MKKLAPQLQSGIEYIQLTRLPFEQLIPFREWISETDRFQLVDDFGTEQECAHYDLYDFWFDSFKEERRELEFEIF